MPFKDEDQKKEYAKAYRKRYYAKNKEAVLEYSKKRKKENREAWHRWKDRKKHEERRAKISNGLIYTKKKMFGDSISPFSHP